MIRLLSAGLLVLLLVGSCAEAAAAVRHHSYVGTITRISATALTIHSKSHATNYTFQIDQSTQFLQRGLAVPKDRFKVGSYVSVSYSAGTHGTLIAYHISLRR